MKDVRTLEVKIAKDVLGLDVKRTRTKKGRVIHTIGKPEYYEGFGVKALTNEVPHYASDLNMLYEVMKGLHTVFSIASYSDEWQVRIAHRRYNTDRVVMGTDKELPIAICKALVKIAE